jgi:hypothetical protein
MPPSRRIEQFPSLCVPNSTSPSVSFAKYFLVFFLIMFSVVSTLAFALSFCALTSGTPLDTRATCHPQFQAGLLGSKVSIINGGKEWSLKFMPPTVGIRIVPRPKDVTNAEFQVRRRPSDGTYAIKYIFMAQIHPFNNY